MEDSQVDCVVGCEGGNGSVTSHMVWPLERNGKEVKSVVWKKNETQAMVLEVRSDGGVDDKGGKEGVVVYTVDTEVDTLEGPIRVLTAEPLSLEAQNVLDVSSWGVKVEIVEKKGDAYVVRIAVRTNGRETALVRGAMAEGDNPLSSAWAFD